MCWKNSNGWSINTTNEWSNCITSWSNACRSGWWFNCYASIKLFA
jgi:hypothetical protein